MTEESICVLKYRNYHKNNVTMTCFQEMIWNRFYWTKYIHSMWLLYKFGPTVVEYVSVCRCKKEEKYNLLLCCGNNKFLEGHQAKNNLLKLPSISKDISELHLEHSHWLQSVIWEGKRGQFSCKQIKRCILTAGKYVITEK